MRVIAGVVKPGQIERYHVLKQENSSCSILIIEDLHNWLEFCFIETLAKKTSTALYNDNMFELIGDFQSNSFFHFAISQNYNYYF